MSNNMGEVKVKKVIWSMGLPAVLSMVLQALYNVIDTMFVINMGEDGALGNLALSAAFPVQIIDDCNRRGHRRWNKCFAFQKSWRRQLGHGKQGCG